jgi:hypothetical protein
MKILPGNGWRIAEMLALKGWLETRWRLMGVFGLASLVMAINYQARYKPSIAKPTLALLWGVLSSTVFMLAGSGVKSQATTHISFPEGLAQSTQFTISLPVSRALLLAVRAGIGLFEIYAATLMIACAVWELFPSISATITAADFVRLGLTMLFWLPLPYSAALLVQAFLPEPWSMLPTGYGLTLLLWLIHKISPAFDVIRAFGVASPLLTHRLPLSQLATADLLAVILLLVAVWSVHKHEY